MADPYSPHLSKKDPAGTVQATFERWWNVNAFTESGLRERDVERIAVAVADEMERRAMPSVLAVTAQDVQRWCPGLGPRRRQP